MARSPQFQLEGSAPVRIAGTALNLGLPVAVTLSRTAGPTTWRQRNREVPHDMLTIARTDRGVTLVNVEQDFHVDLVEHLLAALGAFGIHSNMSIDVEGDELPIGTGGATEFVDAIQTLNVPPSGPKLFVAREGELRCGQSTYSFCPGDRPQLSTTVTFRAPVHSQVAHWDGTPDDFAQNIAPARTFGWLAELDGLKASGRAHGASPASVLIFTESGVMQECRPPIENECAKHKLLDLIGDFAFYGGPPRGRVTVDRPGHGATHQVIRGALQSGLLRRVAAVLLVVTSGLTAVGSAHAEDAQDDVLEPPRPPTLPSLTHNDLSVSFQYTGASILLNDPGAEETSGPDGATNNRAYAWFAHAELEVPLVPRRWYIGAANDLASGAVPGVGSEASVGNPELWTRGTWWNLSGLASGGSLGVVLPLPRSLSEEEAEVLETIQVVRLWDAAYFDDLTLTLRPSFDVRHITGRFIFQLRQGIDWSYAFGEQRDDFAARATFYLGYRIAEPVGLGLELWEVYQITADVPDDKRASVSVSPSIRLMFPFVSPAVSLLFPVATPLRGEAASYVAGRIHVNFQIPIDAPSTSDR